MILLILLIILLFCAFRCNIVKYYTLRKTFAPHVVILGVTHGNEPAGYHALNKIKNISLIRGRVTLVPAINTCGLVLNSRNNPYDNKDINRNYPDGTLLNRQVVKLIRDADWVIDLHEGWGFNRLNPKSIGSGVYPGNTREARVLCDYLTRSINLMIKDPSKKFVTFELQDIQGSLREYCNLKKQHYVLVETSGINDIQDLDLRVEQQEKIVLDILVYLNMIQVVKYQM